MSNCPKCERSLSHLTVETISLKAPRLSLPGITLSCPSCGACVSASVEPVKFANQLLDAIRKGRSRLI